MTESTDNNPSLWSQDQIFRVALPAPIGHTLSPVGPVLDVWKICVLCGQCRDN